MLLRRSPRDGRSWKISKLRRMVNPAFGGFYLNVVTSALHEVPGLSERKLGRFAVRGGDASDVSCAYSVGHLISSFCASFSALQLGLETLWPSWTSARRQRCQPTLGQPTGLSLPVFSELWWFCSSPSTARRLGRSNSPASSSRISTRFAIQSPGTRSVKPVMSPPGRDRLWTRPSPTGSGTATKH